MFKSKRKKLSLGLLSALLLLAFSTSALAGGSYIDLEMGPRPQAMGGAFVAIADDVNSSYWNPAGIVQLNTPVVGFMHSNPFSVEGLSLDYLAFVHPTAFSFLNGGVGISYQRSSANLEEEESTNQMATSIYTLSFGAKLLERVFYGFNFKSINIETNVGDSTAGEAFDFGLLYKFNERYSAGLMMRNLSGKLTNETIASEKRVGIAGRFWDNRFILALDASSKQEAEQQQEAWQLHYGAEFQFTEHVAVRLGYDKDNFTGGVGIQFDFGGLMRGASLDYSYAANQELEHTHRFALSLEVGG